MKLAWKKKKTHQGKVRCVVSFFVFFSKGKFILFPFPPHHKQELPLLLNSFTIRIVLVDRKTDGFQDKICPEWKRDKQKLESSFWPISWYPD